MVSGYVKINKSLLPVAPLNRWEGYFYRRTNFLECDQKAILIQPKQLFSVDFHQVDVLHHPRLAVELR